MVIETAFSTKADSLEIAKRLRHDLSSSLSLIESGMRNITGQNPDISKAMRIHSMGVEKLRAALADLDSAISNIEESK